MPIQIDRKPGRKPLRRNGETAGPFKVSTEPAAAGRTLRIRMLRDLSCKLGTFKAGQIAHVEYLRARSWIGFGLAEEDKSLDAAPEIK